MEHHYRILVVDDEQDLCEILKFNLETEGYQVETANSAEEALQHNLPSFDLLLLDVMMGGMSGFALAKKLLAQGKIPSVILGFNQAAEQFMQADFQALGLDVTVTTADGSLGVKGFVTNALPENYTYFYTCGPEPMLKAVYRSTATSGQLSFEERMGCGFGACMGCSCKTLTGNKRICKDGPVMKKEEILWEA